MNDPVRIGRLTYLNALPLYHGLEVAGAAYVEGTPAQLNALMAEGALDLSVISSAEYLQHRERYGLLPEFCLTARGRVKSVLLISKIPLHELSGCSIALTSSSATSVIMLRAILAAEGVVGYATSRMSPDPDRMSAAATAFFLIGDDALRYKPRPEFHVYDIGEMWVRLTGTPAVFAVLAAQRRFLDARKDRARQIARRMRAALDRNLASLESLPLDADLYPGFDLEPYFELLGYDYNDAAIEGLVVLSRCAGPPGRVSPPLASVEFEWQAGS